MKHQMVGDCSTRDGPPLIGLFFKVLELNTSELLADAANHFSGSVDAECLIGSILYTETAACLVLWKQYFDLKVVRTWRKIWKPMANGLISAMRALTNSKKPYARRLLKFQNTSDQQVEKLSRSLICGYHSIVRARCNGSLPCTRRTPKITGQERISTS